LQCKKSLNGVQKVDGVSRAYYLERAEAELRRGEAATTKRAADAHFELAGRYFDMAYRGAPPDDPSLAPAAVPT
jgi:hypothetical protein